MPFDLARVADRLRQRHGDALGFRHALLDLLFATGTSVSEQAVALEHGDALCIRASSQATASLASELLVVAIDLDPPHLSGVAATMGRPGRWPDALASLGGPEVALAWMAAVRALVSSKTSRPWHAVYVRGPALGLGAYVRGVLTEVSPRTEMVQVVPSVPADAPGDANPCDLVRLDLTRSRNVWRFPACDLGYAITDAAPWPDALTRLNGLLGGLGAEAAWTLHDLHLYHAEETLLGAVLRSSKPLKHVPSGMTATEIDAGRRLMFPVNDALSALAHLAAELAPAWADALSRPVHLHVLPDGLRVFAVAPVARIAPLLPEQAGGLNLHWQVEPLAILPTRPVLPFAISSRERLGPIAPGALASGAVVWQFPTLKIDDDLVGLGRALGAALQ